MVRRRVVVVLSAVDDGSSDDDVRLTAVSSAPAVEPGSASSAVLSTSVDGAAGSAPWSSPAPSVTTSAGGGVPVGLGMRLDTTNPTPNTMAAAPEKTCAAILSAASRGRPIITPPSAIASRLQRTTVSGVRSS